MYKNEFRIVDNSLREFRAGSVEDSGRHCLVSESSLQSGGACMMQVSLNV